MLPLSSLSTKSCLRVICDNMSTIRISLQPLRWQTISRHARCMDFWRHSTCFCNFLLGVLLSQLLLIIWEFALISNFSRVCRARIVRGVMAYKILGKIANIRSETWCFCYCVVSLHMLFICVIKGLREKVCLKASSTNFPFLFWIILYNSRLSYIFYVAPQLWLF